MDVCNVIFAPPSSNIHERFLSFLKTPPSALLLQRLLMFTPPSLPPSLPTSPTHPESTIPEPDLAKPECYTLTTHDQQFGSDPIPMAVRG